MTKISFSSERESYSVILSQIHKSLCLLVKKKSLLKSPSTDQLGLTNLVLVKLLPKHVEAMSGIYVDDYLTAGPPKIVEAFMTTLRKLWKTSEPQFLTLDHELTFLGVILRKTVDGILLHQQLYTDDLPQEHAPHMSARKRTTTGEPEHFQTEAPLPPNPSIPEQGGSRGVNGFLVVSFGFQQGHVLILFTLCPLLLKY